MQFLFKCATVTVLVTFLREHHSIVGNNRVKQIVGLVVIFLNFFFYELCNWTAPYEGAMFRERTDVCNMLQGLAIGQRVMA